MLHVVQYVIEKCMILPLPSKLVLFHSLSGSTYIQPIAQHKTQGLFSSPSSLTLPSPKPSPNAIHFTHETALESFHFSISHQSQSQSLALPSFISQRTQTLATVTDSSSTNHYELLSNTPPQGSTAIFLKHKSDYIIYQLNLPVISYCSQGKDEALKHRLHTKPLHGLASTFSSGNPL